MEDTTSSSSTARTARTAGPRVNRFTMAVEQPFLARMDPESIRVFLRKYDAYCRELTARTSQLVQEVTVSLDPIRPVGLTYCVDAEQLESAVDCGWIADCDDVKTLTDDQLRTFLDAQSEESSDAVTEQELGQMVLSLIKMDMSVKSAEGRMKLLFMKYRSLLRTNGLKWVIENSPKVAIRHVLSVIKPQQLRTRLEQDIKFSKAKLKSDFSGFQAHAIGLSQAFERLDTGPPKSRKSEGSSGKTTTDYKKSAAGNDNKAGGKTKKDKVKTKRQPPSPCPQPACDGKKLMHWADDCENSTDAEKKAFKDKVAASKSRDGPARSTRSQTSSAGAASSSASKTVGRLQRKSDASARDDDSPSCKMTIMDGKASQDVTGRCDDGSDENIASSKLAVHAVGQGIGKIDRIDTVRVKVALTKEDEAPTYTFSRVWSVPVTVLHLNSGRLALKNIRFLVADDNVTCEDLLIGLPVLRHLRVDSKTLLDDNITSLHGTDCSPDGPPETNGGQVSRIMIARLNRVRDDHVDSSAPLDPARLKVNYYSARAEEDPFPDPSLLEPIDGDQHEDIKTTVNDMKTVAQDNGMPEEDRPTLKTLLADHMDIFCTSFSSGPPAVIPALKVALTRDAKPVKVRVRNYSQDERDLMDRFVKDLAHHGLAYANPTSKWACARLLGPKPGARFRFTVDLRPVNKFSVRHQYPMPNLEHELTKLGTSRYFATFDLSHGYWQLPFSVESQECQSFITPDGIFSPTRVLHGTTNAVTHLQSAFAGIIHADLQANMLSWLDDILIPAPTVSGLLKSIPSFFVVCADHNIKLHPAKCILLAKGRGWCGRLVSSSGLRYNPHRLDGLLSMQPPTTGANLQQFVCALQWVKQGILSFSELVAPLHDFMERVYDHVTKRTKSAVAGVLLVDLGWDKTELDAFEACKNALVRQVTVAHRDVGQCLCVYTDASDTAWSGIVTQVPFPDIVKPHKYQRHSPLAFLSRRFNKTQMSWSVLEKGAYAVLTSFDRVHWIVATPEGFDLYTDHNNLIFLFDPLSVVPDMSQTSLRKVLRWAVRLSMYRFTCYHIKGDDNIWADLLTRSSTVPATVRRLVRISELPSSSSTDFDWPTRTTLPAVQQAHDLSRPADLVLNDQLWTLPSGSIWVPDDAADIQLRLCIIAHTGPSGHRGVSATEQALLKSFHWSTLKADVRAFVRACIHCLSTVRGEKIPRPFGPAVHGTKANDLLQFDYIELGATAHGDKYALMLRDDHSDYKWFFPFPDTSAENAATAIIEWCAAFGVPNGLMSDGSTHFKNETVCLVSKGLKVPHHFTLPYCPWSNRAVERLGRELLRFLRSVLSELQMRTTEWPDLIPIAQSVLNNSPSPQRGNMCPITAFMGKEPTPSVQTFMRTSLSTPVTLTEAQAERTLNVQKFIELRDELHPLVQSNLVKHLKQARAAASRGKHPHFTEGDYVFVARTEYGAGDKLVLIWRGPRRVIKALSDYVYQVEDLQNGQMDDVHSTRLKFYRDDAIDEAAILSHILQSESGMPVARLMGLEDSPDGLKVHVCWKGLDNSEDTVEPLERVFEDVPMMVERLLKRKATPAHLVQKANALLAI